MAWDRAVPVLTEWVAILRTAERIEDLHVDASTLLQRVPDHGLIGRVDAHVGLAERLGVHPKTWVSGVVGETRSALEAALSRAGPRGASPLVVDRFRVVRLST
ncbi:MAG TPA: hypothetical protein VHH92_06765 [Actinomycetota bacterium]|nr:hypothetical protein [Actinomycetota bacterium]